MTCIAGLAHDGKVYMGGDSACLFDTVLLYDALPKVYRRGEFIIGAAGSARLSDLLHYVFNPPKIPDKVSLDAFMVSKFAPAMRKCFEESGYENRDEDDMARYNGRFLIGVRGRLYNIDGNCAVSRSIDNVDAIGSGCEIALGSLLSTPRMKPEKRIDLALKLSAKKCQAVRPPFVMEIL